MQIYQQILSEIESGTFKVGDKLPAERELCEQFGVSRAPIRQALSALELNGFIYSRQGEGVYVKSNQSLANNSQNPISFDSVSPEEIVEVRMNIEPLIIKFAVQRATDEEITVLRETINKMEEETKSGVYVPETDEALHYNIAKASHNELFINIMAAIITAMKKQEMWQFIRDRTVTRPEYLEVNLNEHKQIIEAIETRDEKKATDIMSNHMQNLYDRYWK